jgi:hypothetical protein
MAWMDWLFGASALKKAAKTGDAPANTPQPSQPVPNYVEDQIKNLAGKPGDNDTETVDTSVPPGTATPGPKKQPRIGFPPKKQGS